MLRFEHEVIEVALTTALKFLQDGLVVLTDKLGKFGDEYKSQFSKNTQISQVIKIAEIFPLKTKLQGLRKRALEINRALIGIMSDDAQMVKLIINSGSTPVSSSASSPASSNPSPNGHDSKMSPKGVVKSDPVSAYNASNSQINPMRAVNTSQKEKQKVNFAEPADNEFHRVFHDAGVNHAHNPDHIRPSFAFEPERPSTAAGEVRESLSLRASRSFRNMGAAPRRANRRVTLMAAAQLENILSQKPLLQDVEMILDNIILGLGWISSEIEEILEMIVLFEGKHAEGHFFLFVCV